MRERAVEKGTRARRYRAEDAAILCGFQITVGFAVSSVHPLDAECDRSGYGCCNEQSLQGNDGSPKCGMAIMDWTKYASSYGSDIREYGRITHNRWYSDVA
jgi:hypothetical protein